LENGTVGSFLKEHFQCEIVAPGDIFRRIRKEDSKLGESVREQLKDGGYCSDELTCEIILDEIVKLDGKPFILDGFPRTMAQYDFVKAHMTVDYYICLDAPYEALVQSSANRIFCAKCNKVWSKLREENDCCPFSSENWIRRFDDAPDIYLKRYAIYQEFTQPIIDVVSKLPNNISLQSLNNPNVNSELLERIELLENFLPASISR
jgi:adenylate kinase